jgi:hypothetical protein
MGMATVTAFLAGQPDNGTSMAALHAKAAILFEQAASLAGRYRPRMLLLFLGPSASTNLMLLSEIHI